MNRRDFAINFLRNEGYSDDNKIGEILSGFDFSQHVENKQLEPDDTLIQFVRRSSLFDPCQKIGNWFCLSGATMDRLAIMSGGEGRLPTLIKVVYPCVALEGVARKMARNWSWSGGGAGGGTQLFVPGKYLMSCMEIIGFG